MWLCAVARTRIHTPAREVPVFMSIRVAPQWGERTSVNRFLLCGSAALLYSDRALMVSMIRFEGTRAHSDLSIRSAMSLRTEAERVVSVEDMKCLPRRTLDVV